MRNRVHDYVDIIQGFGYISTTIEIQMENVENERETAGLCAVGMRFLKEVSDGRQLCLSPFFS